MTPPTSLRSFLWILLWWFCCFLSSSAFDADLSVVSCTMDTLVVKVSNASDTGLIYVLGQGDACKFETSAAQQIYQFDFASCGISWQLVLKIIIQKEKDYQTGADKKIPVLCIADTTDLITSNLMGADTIDNNGLNITVRPTAMMTFYKAVTNELVSGSEVKLTDRLVMVLQLDAEYSEDFDFKAKYCTAGGIVIIDNYCATDPELFPNFWKTRQGYMMSEFGAFRETSIEGGSVRMNFTCILQLCKDFCNPSLCGDVYDGWGRKRRSVNIDPNHLGYISASGSPSVGNHREKRQTRDGPDDSIAVVAKIDVVDKYSDIKVIDENEVCWQNSLFILIFIAVGSCLITTAGACIYLIRKLVHCKMVIKKLEDNSLSKPLYMTAEDCLKLKRGNSICDNKC